MEKNLTLGVVIAGGKSSRMGDMDKLLLPFGDKSMIDMVIDRLRPQVSNLYLNINDVKLAEHVSLKVVPDSINDNQYIGPISGLFTALKMAKNLGFSKVVTAPGDTPFLPENFVEKLEMKKGADVVVASSGGRQHPILALWNTKVTHIIEGAIEARDYKLMSLLDRLNVAVVTWDDNPDPFFNVNTSEDYSVALKRL